MIKLQSLGQVGYRLDILGTIIYIDPYLSNSVQEKENTDISRLIPIPIMPFQVKDANYILITHKHRDHCDEDTLVPLAKVSPNCKFVAPINVGNYLLSLGISLHCIIFIKENPIQINNTIKLYPIPSAHPNIQVNMEGGWNCIGYVIEIKNKRLYHAGDTSVDDKLITALKKIGHINVGFIPVNETNYYRERCGIIGNMSVRDAFMFAEEIGVEVFIPTHWDMFAINQVYREEIELLYSKLKPSFKLLFNPTEL